MEFLFHTVVGSEGQPVYYNIYSCGEGHYFAEILDNPNKVKEAKDFKLEMINGSWQSSENISTRIMNEILEEIMRSTKH